MPVEYQVYLIHDELSLDSYLFNVIQVLTYSYNLQHNPQLSLNSAGRWPIAKPTRNPHGVKEKEVFSSKANSHSFIPSLWLPIFYPISPLCLFQTHIFSIFFIFLFRPPHLPLHAIRTAQNSFPLGSHFSYTCRFSQSQSALLLFILLFFLSFYSLQLLALVLGPFRIVSFDKLVQFNLMVKYIKTNKPSSEAKKHEESHF